MAIGYKTGQRTLATAERETNAFFTTHGARGRRDTPRKTIMLSRFSIPRPGFIDVRILRLSVRK